MLSHNDIRKELQPGRYFDGDGLHLRVFAGGAKAWYLRVSKDGSKHDLKIGAFPDMSLADARREAKAHRKAIKAGKEPKSASVARAVKAKSSPSFEHCAIQYMDGHVSAWTKKHDENWRQSLRDYAFPYIGKKPVNEITVDDVLAAIEPIWHTKTETAARVLSRIRIVLGWAKARKYRTGDNPAAWTDNISHILPDRDKVCPVKHHAALPFREIPAFIAKLRQCDDFAAPCLLFTILTAVRSGEARGAVWSEIDLGQCEWIIPASRMKAAREHRIPLSAQAARIVAELDFGRHKPDALVFPSIRKGAAGGGMISHISFSRVLKACGYANVTTHGFRSTFRDWAAETTDHANEVVEMSLAHAIGSKVEAAYRRGNLLAKRRALMDEWSAFCFSGLED